MLEKCRSSLPRSHSMRSKSTVFCSSVIGISFCSARLCSVGLGLAGAFELAARTLSASLRPRPGRAERKRTDPDKPSLPRDASQGGAADACCTPSPLGLAGALDLAARARSASLGRSTGQSLTKTNRTRQASGQAYSETLRWAGPRMLVALNTETSILRALNARVRTSIYIYIYIWPFANPPVPCATLCVGRRPRTRLRCTRLGCTRSVAQGWEKMCEVGWSV